MFPVASLSLDDDDSCTGRVCGCCKVLSVALFTEGDVDVSCTSRVCDCCNVFSAISFVCDVSVEFLTEGALQAKQRSHIRYSWL